MCMSFSKCFKGRTLLCREVSWDTHYLKGSHALEEARCYAEGSVLLGGKNCTKKCFPRGEVWFWSHVSLGSLSMGELSLYNTGMVRQTWVWEFDITILHRKGNVRSKTFSCFVPCAPIPEDSIPGVPTYPYPPTACLKVHFNYDASYDTPKGYEYSTGGRFL